MDWRIRAEADGEHLVTINIQGKKIGKSIIVSKN